MEPQQLKYTYIYIYAYREIMRTLKRVDLFKCLTLGQLQRLADLLNEGALSSALIYLYIFMNVCMYGLDMT